MFFHHLAVTVSDLNSFICSLYLISEEIMQVTGRRHYKLCFKSCTRVITLLQICFAYVGGSTRICFLILIVKTPIVEIMLLNGNRKTSQRSLFQNVFRLLLLVMKIRAVRTRRSNVLLVMSFFFRVCLWCWFNEHQFFGCMFPCFSL